MANCKLRMADGKWGMAKEWLMAPSYAEASEGRGWQMGEGGIFGSGRRLFRFESQVQIDLHGH